MKAMNTLKQLNEARATFKSKLRTNKCVFGGWTSIAHPQITEIMTRAGFDFIGIDIEHSTISQEQSQRIIAASHANGVLCLPRIASHNMEMIKRLLDSGADGIIVPMVDTPQDVEDIIRWSKYSPLGKRSFGISRAQGYGFDFDEYVNSWNSASTVIVQIESIEGVDNINEILSCDQVDGAMIGPYDLSGSLGIPGQLDNPLVTAAGKKVIAACKGHNKACGTQLTEPDLKSIKTAKDAGYTLIVLASDVFLLWKWSENMGNIIRQAQ
ncbi:MAG: aldolase/citrate lyase family protein [Methanoregula sp.]|nr:MAG: aldolase/citrate lyase family protein [Methanoregula sp.]